MEKKKPTMTKPLKFFHVPKTAGSSIENSAREYGINWGCFDREYLIKWKTPGSLNHQPLYQAKDESIYRNWLQDYDFFCVVRNPYEKCISELFYETRYSADLSVEQFNRIICNRIKENRISNHWAPQYLFVFDGEKQIIKHVLKYENIDEEFDLLMKEYNLPVKLTDRSNVGNKKYTISDLAPETIQTINEFQREDFVRFGYHMLEVEKQHTEEKLQIQQSQPIPNQEM